MSVFSKDDYVSFCIGLLEKMIQQETAEKTEIKIAPLIPSNAMDVRPDQAASVIADLDLYLTEEKVQGYSILLYTRLSTFSGRVKIFYQLTKLPELNQEHSSGEGAS